MVAHRLFQIVNILLAKKEITAGELAKEFGVSVRTIYRDIDELSASGIPVYATQGRGGGISLVDKYVLDKSLLSSSEQEQILMALKNISTTSSDVATLLVKMQALFQKGTVDWMEVDLSRWGNKELDTQKFDRLRRGILQKQVTTFCYVNGYGKKSDKKVQPAKLVFKSKAWYLQAFCLEAQDYRTYKLHRLSNVALQNEHFTDNLIPPPIEGYVPAHTFSKITLKFDKNIAHRVHEEFDDSDITLDNDNNFIVAIRMPEDEWLYGYFLSFGALLEVVEPQHIGDILKKRGLEIFDVYNRRHPEAD